MENLPKFYSPQQFKKIVECQEQFIQIRLNNFVKLINDVTVEHLKVISFINSTTIYIATNGNYLAFADFAYHDRELISIDLYHELASCLDAYDSESRVNFFDHIYHPERDEELKQKIKDAFEKVFAKVQYKNKLIESALSKLTDEEKIAVGLNEKYEEGK